MSFLQYKKHWIFVCSLSFDRIEVKFTFKQHFFLTQTTMKSRETLQTNAKMTIKTGEALFNQYKIKKFFALKQ